MNIPSALTILALAIGLAGCASSPLSPPSSATLLNDAAFAPPTVRIAPTEVMAMSPAMQRFADDKLIRSEVRTKGLREGLISALYNKGQLQLGYETADTKNAAEAFEARNGNCLSLVLMTAAFARYFNLPVSFNSVYVEDVWTRYNGLYVAAGHVNITLARIAVPTGAFMYGSDNAMTIDFLPSDQLKGQRSRVIDESTVVAMYLNNRAVETLTEGDVDNAYWWVRAAIQADPRWLASYNTLAVLYRRKGLEAQAEVALRLLLEREPMNAQALSNMAMLLGDHGRTAEARVMKRRLEEVQPVPPYQYFDQGMAAIRAGDYASARNFFRKEVARDAYVSEFHFWLAVASYGTGDLAFARGEIAKALENSTTSKDRELYSAKQAWLNRQRSQ